MSRQALTALAVAALLLSSGCLGLVFGDGLEGEAQPARVDQATVDETEFTFEQADTIEIDETVEAGGQERRIEATNHVALYSRTADVPTGQQQAGGFVVVSTPQFAVAGQPLNPAARMSNEELVERFEGQIESQMGGDVRNLRVVDQRTEPVLGVAANVTTFAAETTMEGQEVTLNVHVTSVTHEDDVIVAVGVHPEALQQQAPEIFALMRGIEHPAEA